MVASAAPVGGELQIELPNDFTPRFYQEPSWKAMEEGCKRIVNVWHRRSGKDLTYVNKVACEAFKRKGLYWHLLPTYKQGRNIVWNGMDKEGRPFLEAFPEGSYYRKRDDEMTMWLQNGSIYQVVGTDHMDRLVGSNPIGCIFSEYSLQNPAAWDLIRPILAQNGGWAAFIYTPRGRNHGYKLLKQAEDNPNWFAQVLTVDDTGAVPMEQIEDDRRSGMPEEMIQQEYWCSFDAPLVGSYYGDILEWMIKEKPPRITKVPWAPNIEVLTGWDLGKADSTAIWFGQWVGRQWRIIDYEQFSRMDIAPIVKKLREKPYAYGDAYLPHDAAHERLGMEKSILSQLQDLNVRTILIGKHPKVDQIAAVRLMLRQMWIDEDKCELGLQSLREFVKSKIEGERGPGGEILYRDDPARNWATHGADAMASFCLGARAPSRTEFRQPDTGYVT